MTGAAACRLEPPTLGRLPDYIAALQTGWSPSTTRDLSGEHLEAARADPASFIAELARTEGGTVTLADGTVVPRLPGRLFWIVDPAFCGVINLRHVPGSHDLPPHVSGHVGYAVVPWRRNRGVARQALAMLLPIAAGLGLERVLLTCDPANPASRRVIEATGGVFAGEQAFADQPGVTKLLFWLSTRA